MRKKTRSRYTLEYKLEAVKLVRSGMRPAAAARELGISEQTLHAWLKADGKGTLKAAGSVKAVSAEQMELARLKAELARVKMERDILRKATAYFARESL